jgi:cold shock protein
VHKPGAGQTANRTNDAPPWTIAASGPCKESTKGNARESISLAANPAAALVIRGRSGTGPFLWVEFHVSGLHQLERQVATGTVKWFNATKGYGFIQPSDGGKDVFVHISAVERAGLSNLNEGQSIEYELTTGRNGKSSAENLRVK